MNFEFNLEGLEKLIKDLAPSAERPIKWLLLTTIVFMLSLPWIAGMLMIDRLMAPEQRQPLSLGYVASGTALIFVAFALGFTIFILYKQGGSYKRRAENSDEKLNRIKAVIDEAPLDRDTRGQLEEVFEEISE